MRLASVPARDVGRAWPRVGPWIEAACQRAGCDHSADDLRGLCERAEAQLIAVSDADGRSVAAGVTQVRDHDDGTRSCWVLAVGGKGARDWRDTLREIEDGARRNGCDRIEFVGRPGWAALLPGYATETYFRKDLAA